MIRTLTAILLLQGLILPAQHLRFSAGSPSAALANSSVCKTDAWAPQHNPAAAVWSEESSIALGLQHPNLGLGLYQSHLAASHQSKWGALLAQFTYRGVEHFNRGSIGLGYARRFGSKLSFGLNARYDWQYTAEATDQAGAFSLDCGALAHLSDQLRLGFALYNLNNAELNADRRSKRHTSFRLGCAYRLHPKMDVSLELQHMTSAKAQTALGLEYLLHPKLPLRMGFRLPQLQNSFGMGYKLHFCELDVHATYDWQLGTGIGLSLSFPLP